MARLSHEQGLKLLLHMAGAFRAPRKRQPTARRRQSNRKAGGAGIAITGDIELDQVLKEIGAASGAKSINAAARKACKRAITEIVLPAVQDLIPVDSGFLEDQIVVRAMKSKRGRFGYVVGFKDPLYQGDTFYAGFIEFGWDHTLGFHVEADSFLRQALYPNADKVIAAARDYMRAWVADLNNIVPNQSNKK